MKVPISRLISRQSLLGLLAFPLVTIIGIGTAEAAEDYLASGQLMIRSHLEPGDTVTVAQQTTLVVEVLTNSWFTAAPRFPELRIPDAIVLMPDKFADNYTDRIDAESYAVQRRSYHIYPQRAGQYDIPPLSVTLAFALEDAKPSELATLVTEPLAFEARMPEAAAGLNNLITTSSLTLEEKLEPEADAFKVGDALERTITMTAENSVGMMLPVLEFEPIEGLGVYPNAPIVTDDVYRGANKGIREESVTYVMEQEGAYRLPEVQVHWWDAQKNVLHQETLAAIEFTVRENPNLAAAHLGGDSKQIVGAEADADSAAKQARAISAGQLIGIAALVIVWWLLRRNRRAIRRRVVRSKERRQRSEAALLSALQQACQWNDSQAVMKLLMNWLDHYGPDKPVALLERFIERSADPELARVCEALLQQLYRQSGRKGWKASGLYRRLCRARKKLHPVSQGRWHFPEPALGMNPGDYQKENNGSDFS